MYQMSNSKALIALQEHQGVDRESDSSLKHFPHIIGNKEIWDYIQTGVSSYWPASYWIRASWSKLAVAGQVQHQNPVPDLGDQARFLLSCALCSD